MKYVLTLYADESGWDELTPEELRAEMQPWSDFEQRLFDAGALVTSEGLQPSVTATTVKIGEGNERMITDGPFAETKEQLGGILLLECENLDETLEWAKQVPLPPGSSIEVRPVMDYTQFGFVDPTAKSEAAS